MAGPGESPTQFNVEQAALGLVTDAAQVVIDAITTGPTSPATISAATVLVADGVAFTENEMYALIGRAVAWEQKNGSTIVEAIEKLLAKL